MHMPPTPRDLPKDGNPGGTYELPCKRFISPPQQTKLHLVKFLTETVILEFGRAIYLKQNSPVSFIPNLRRDIFRPRNLDF
jgi:hypothetical protein